MGHHCTYFDKLVFDEKKKMFYRSITAVWKDRQLEIARVFENGKAIGRNLSFSYMGGYNVDFPGEIVRYKYTREKYIVEEEDFTDIYWSFKLWVGHSIINKKYILEKDPSLKYLIQKFNGTRNDVLLPLIATYRVHPEIETLVEKGQYKLAVDKRLHKLTKKKKTQVINFVKENMLTSQDMSLSNIFTCIKNNIPYNLIETYKACGDDKILFKYLVKQNQSYEFYRDYKKMAIKAGHDFNQEYWKYPKSLQFAHEKVMEECKNMDSAVNIVLNKQLEIIGGKLKKQEKIINGLHYYIVQSYDDFANQANALKQCLITAGYIKKIIEQKSVLIFIKDSKLKPVGTVEIDYNKRILQAYGNESDRSKCMLPNEIMANVKEYVSHLKIRKYKFKFSLPKNCFFKGLYEGNQSFNNLKFEEGKVYSTNYSDEEIIKKGSNCLASDRVYHFCETIADVKTWVLHPTSYAIVEALGPVVRRNNALGTNKIKIKKITTEEDIAKVLLAMNKAVSNYTIEGGY